MGVKVNNFLVTKAFKTHSDFTAGVYSLSRGDKNGPEYKINAIEFLNHTEDEITLTLSFVQISSITLTVGSVAKYST